MKSMNQLAKIVADKAQMDNVHDLSREIWWKLVKQKQYGRLDQLIEDVDALIAKRNNMLRAVAVFATTPQENDLAELKSKLEKKFGKEIELDTKIDPELLGGMKIYVEDTTIDLSYRTKLNQLKTRLAGANE